MQMTLSGQLVIIALAALGTMLTRFAPFWLFPKGRPVPAAVAYLGKVLPGAVMAMLVVYCLKDVSFALPPHGVPELVSMAAVAVLHAWKKNILLSVGGGTVLYMALVQLVFA